MIVVEVPSDPKGMLCDAVPDVITFPFTVTVAVGSCVMGVTVTDETALPTDAVYVVVLPVVPVFVNAETGVSAIVVNKALADLMP